MLIRKYAQDILKRTAELPLDAQPEIYEMPCIPGRESPGNRRSVDIDPSLRQAIVRIAGELGVSVEDWAYSALIVKTLPFRKTEVASPKKTIAVPGSRIRPVYREAPPSGKLKKSEAMTVEKFSVSTQWVNVKFNASHIVVGRLSKIPIGLVRAASDSIHSFALCICMKAGGASWGDGPLRTRDQTLEALRHHPRYNRPLLFINAAPGQKLLPVELRMEHQKWETVRLAAAIFEVSVVSLCKEALHQRSMELAANFPQTGKLRKGEK